MFIRGYSQNTTVQWAMAQQNPKQGVPIRPIAIGKGHKTNNDGSSGQKRCAKQMSRCHNFWTRVNDFLGVILWILMCGCTRQSQENLLGNKDVGALHPFNQPSPWLENPVNLHAKWGDSQPWSWLPHAHPNCCWFYIHISKFIKYYITLNTRLYYYI